MNDNLKSLETSKPSPLEDREPLTLTVVGVGLISGSFALALKEKGFAKHVIGVSKPKQAGKKRWNWV